MSVSEPVLIGHDVSRETLQKIEIIVAQLQKWQPHINLVASSTLPHLWQRHIIDSLQLVNLIPNGRRWIDLGSGGGFPGLVIAAALSGDENALITLVESNGKKCAFLRETARLAKLPVTVFHGRIEDIVSGFTQSYDVVSARALASLDALLGYAAPFIASGAVGIFPKGQDVDGELKLASISWNFSYDLVDSQTEMGAKIVVVKSAMPIV